MVDRHHARDHARGRRARLRGAHGQGVAVRGPRRAARRAGCRRARPSACAASLLEDPWAVCLGGEPVRIDRETAGRVTTGGYGYRVERSIAYAYLPADAGPGVVVEVDIFGELVTGVSRRRAPVRPAERAHQGLIGDESEQFALGGLTTGAYVRLSNEGGRVSCDVRRARSSSPRWQSGSRLPGRPWLTV